MNKEKILICGVLPPPVFGHSKMYEMLMSSDFPKEFEVTFLDMRFWTYDKHKRITLTKLFKFIYYYLKFIALIILKRPQYVLYNISFDKMPFLKDFIFCFTAKLLGRRLILHDMGQYVKELYEGSNRMYQSMICWLAKRATASIILGHNVKEVYRGFMEEQRLFVVPGCVEDTAGILKQKSRVSQA